MPDNDHNYYYYYDKQWKRKYSAHWDGHVRPLTQWYTFFEE